VADGALPGAEQLSESDVIVAADPLRYGAGRLIRIATMNQ
jgi:hypothetical protein